MQRPGAGKCPAHMKPLSGRFETKTGLGSRQTSAARVRRIALVLCDFRMKFQA